MTFTISDIIAAAKRHFSIIGKRLYSKDGHNMFADITLSSAEDTEILTQYITTSAHDIEAALSPLISATTITTSSISMTIANTRGDSDFQTRAQDMVKSYLTLNTVGEYLAMLHPDIAQKYQRDAVQRLQALIAYVFYKKPPTAAAADPLSAISSSVLTGNDNTSVSDEDNLTNNTNMQVEDP